MGFEPLASGRCGRAHRVRIGVAPDRPRIGVDADEHAGSDGAGVVVRHVERAAVQLYVREVGVRPARDRVHGGPDSTTAI